MSNERIDLTQFEEKEYEEEYDEMQDMAPTEYLDSVLDMRRKLTAELKRCYEEIDGLLETIGGWGYVMCPRSNEWFEWDYGCQSETCSSHDDDCRELVEASE